MNLRSDDKRPLSVRVDGSQIRRAIEGERGGALVETAFVLPILMVLVLGAADFGRVFYAAMTVTQAVKAGIQYGGQSIGKAADTAGEQAAAAAAATDISGFTAIAYAPGTGQNPCTCWNASAGTEANMASCTSSCTGSVRMYAYVTGSKTFTTFANYPGLPHSIVITRSASIRVQ
jgi:Flp pilus assembly protein TadG